MSFQIDERFLTDPATGRRVHVETAWKGEVARGWVLLLHGLGDHIGRHEWVKQLLISEGYGVLGLDWPGCGKSDGVRGDLPLVPDGREIVSLAVKEYGVTLTGAIGHSAGGFFLMRFLQDRRDDFASLRWAWFSSPLVRPDANQGPHRIAAARFLARLLPRFTLSTHVRRDDCYHTAPDEDPAHLPFGCHSRVSLRFGSHLLEQTRDGASLASGFPGSLRYLFTVGLSDPVCPPQFVESCYQALSPEARTLIAMSGARHEPFREPNRRELISSIRLWLKEQAR